MYEVQPWHIKKHPQASILLPQQVAQIQESLRRASPDKQLATLKDTREIHRQLFTFLTPEGGEIYAGNYRGTVGTILEHRRSAVFYTDVENIHDRHPALEPVYVAEYMDRLASFITKTWQEKDVDNGLYLRRCARIFGTFSKIHPYLDGNGHISRIILWLLIEHHPSLALNEHWVVHPRPYGLEMSIALQHYKQCPIVLEQILKLWVVSL